LLTPPKTIPTVHSPYHQVYDGILVHSETPAEFTVKLNLIILYRSSECIVEFHMLVLFQFHLFPTYQLLQSFLVFQQLSFQSILSFVTLMFHASGWTKSKYLLCKRLDALYLAFACPQCNGYSF
jgi:hypothetical protein